MDHGRRRHYGTFYGLDPLPADDRPVLVVHGNCQAESLRVLLTGATRRPDGGSGTGPFHTVRVPPVHELVDTDLPFLTALLSRTAVLVSQPVRRGYRQLPIGTDDVVPLLPGRARVLRVPIIRYLGLHPYQAIVRAPADPAAVPALVPYHDLRTLTAVRDGLPAGAAIDRVLAVDAAPDALRSVARLSLAELRRREQECDVAVSDLVPGFGAGAVHTVNHPGNALLIALARRVQQALAVPPAAADPGRVLLGEVVAPLEPAVLAAHDLPGPATACWTVRGAPVPVADVVAAHLAWYRTRPAFVGAGLERHADRIDRLGLGNRPGPGR